MRTLNRGAAIVGALVLSAVVGGGAKAPPPNSVAIDLAADYKVRVVGERAIGLGQAVNAGDVNGDEIPDALVSAPGRRSVVYVIYGARTWRRTIPLGVLSAERGYRIADRREHRDAAPVANAGDVNGDGILDQLVGIPDDPEPCTSSTGGGPAGPSTWTSFSRQRATASSAPRETTQARMWRTPATSTATRSRPADRRTAGVHDAGARLRGLRAATRRDDRPRDARRGPGVSHGRRRSTRPGTRCGRG